MSIPRSAAPYVYFVRRTDGEGPVKIGCSQAPLERLSQLMVWSPYALEVVATIPGDETLERRFHARFREQHSHREWFHPSPELALTIEAVAAGTFDVSALPIPKGLPSPKRKPWTEESKISASNGWRLNRLAKRGIWPPREINELTYSRYTMPEDERLQRALRVRAWIDAQFEREAA